MKNLIRETIQLRAFGILKIPMLFYLSPSVVQFDPSKIVVKIPLNYRTKNHLGSMYFGALCAGADLAGGLLAMRLITKSGNKVSLIFKDFHANFLKRAEGDVHFECADGKAISELMDRTVKSTERQNLAVNVTALTPDKTGQEPIALFKLTLSLKNRA